MIGLLCSHDPVVCPRDQVYRFPGKFKTLTPCLSMDMIDHSLENSDVKDTNELVHREIITAQTLTIVEEDTSLGSADDQGGVGELEHPQGILDNGEEEVTTYQFRSGEGVTYRVVSVQPSDNVDSIPQIVSSNTNNFSNSNNQASGVQALLASPINGQFYVIGSPPEVFGQVSQTNNRNLIPRSGFKLEQNMRSPSARPRDDRRRATHNEVERRRRDKINNWIMKLSKIIPECSQDSSKGSFETQSKGGILAKACDYIMELRTANQRLGEYLKENEQLVSDMELLSRQIEELRLENDQLRAQLAEHGISPCLDPLSIT